MEPTLRGKNLKGGTYYEWQWHREWMAVRKNPNGATGWATILRTTDPTCNTGTVIRIHLWKNNPCTAVYAASKYGMIGSPIHLQEVQEFPDVPAVVEAWGDPTAVADDLRNS